MQPQTPQAPRRLRLLAALRKQIETTSIFVLGCELDEIRAAFTFNQWLRRCGTLRYVLRYVTRCLKTGI